MLTVRSAWTRRWRLNGLRGFLGELDRTTFVALIVGAFVGQIWLLHLPVGLAITGVVAPIGAILLILRHRWLEVGVFLAAIGIVPSIAYRIGGPPALPDPLPEGLIPVEVLAPGGAYFFLVAGLIVIAVAGVLGAHHGARRERQEEAHRRRRERTDTRR